MVRVDMTKKAGKRRLLLGLVPKIVDSYLRELYSAYGEQAYGYKVRLTDRLRFL